MAYLVLKDVKPWTDNDRLTLAFIDEELESQIAAQVIAKASAAFDTSSWQNTATTPRLIISIMAMLYVGREFQKRYIDSLDENTHYGTKLISDAWALLDSIIAGLVTLVDVDGNIVVVSTMPDGIVFFEPQDSEPKFFMEMGF